MRNITNKIKKNHLAKHLLVMSTHIEEEKKGEQSKFHINEMM